MVKVFGPIDIAQTLTLVWALALITLSIYKYSRALESKSLADREDVWRADAKSILKSVAIPTIIFLGLACLSWATTEITNIGNVPVNTNRIDTQLCDKLKFLQCSFPRVNCQQFRREPNGSWISSPDATLVYPDAPGSFAGNIIGPHSMRIRTPNGPVDLTQYLDETCQSELRKMAQ